MRLLSIDYGTKRTGIAVTDPLQLIASGLCTVPTPTLLTFLKSYLAQESVEAFPTIPIHRQDERFTSKLAFQSMIDSGLKKKQRQNKALIDEVSATIILQEFLSTKK